jgi:hypothetical protein
MYVSDEPHANPVRAVNRCSVYFVSVRTGIRDVVSSALLHESCYSSKGSKSLPASLC